ncbi:hypothetical protein OC861_005622 [Tilletia horrida]|nr:hypothetical protein OC861_005622 [Tilletia horrida]
MSGILMQIAPKHNMSTADREAGNFEPYFPPVPEGMVITEYRSPGMRVLVRQDNPSGGAANSSAGSSRDAGRPPKVKKRHHAHAEGSPAPKRDKGQFEGVPKGPSRGSRPPQKLQDRLSEPQAGPSRGPPPQQGAATRGGPVRGPLYRSDQRLPKVPYFNDAATGSYVLLPPLGKAWHPRSGSFNGRTTRISKVAGKFEAAELAQARIRALSRLAELYETEFAKEWKSNDTSIRDAGYMVLWQHATSMNDGVRMGDLRAGAIGAQIRGTWERKGGKPHEHHQRLEVCRRINNILRDQYPSHELQVVPFGSTATGMALKSSDLDLCILDAQRREFELRELDRAAVNRIMSETSLDLPPFYQVKRIARALERSPDFGRCQPIVGARVPIVKYVDLRTRIEGDININNRFGVVNSQMISAYCDLLPMLARPLITFVKSCFKAWGFNDPAGATGPSSFNSYTLALLVIYQLQQDGLLPNLQDVRLLQAQQVPARCIFHAGSKGDRAKREIIPAETAFDTTFFEWRTAYAQLSAKAAREQLYEQYERATGVKLVEEPTTLEGQDLLLGESFLRFLHFFNNFDWESNAICFARSTAIPRSNNRPLRDDAIARHDGVDQWYMQFAIDESEPSPVQSLHPDFEVPELWASHGFIVQDPFITTRNTAGNIMNAVKTNILKQTRKIEAQLKTGELDDEVLQLRAKATPSKARVQLLPNLAEVCRVPRYREVLQEIEKMEAEDAASQTIDEEAPST